MNRNMNRKAAYIWEQNLLDCCDRLPAVINRASMVHSLITAYGLLEQYNVIRSQPASYTELKLFHSDLYLDHLKKFCNVDEDYIPSTEDEEYGLGYDCPPVSDMYSIVSTIAGGTLTAAKSLILGVVDVAINWCGGWHHANRFGAEGFCYVNDIVVAIEKLKMKFPKVLYIDMDVHHGNGVQDAYNLSKSVFTLSFHKYEPGFYPGSGNIDDIGTLNGRGFACNFPLNAPYSDENFEYAFERVFNMICSCYIPDAIVVQCGADALARDPNGGAGLTLKGYCSCIENILSKKKPTMLLGGGGYNHANTARLWVTITALVVGVQLQNNIPEHSFWPKYGPDYTIIVQPLLSKDMNSKDYLDKCIGTIKANLNKYLYDNDLENQGPSVKKRRIADDERHSTEKKLSILQQNLNVNTVKANNEHNNCGNTNTVDVYDFVD